MLNKHLVQSFKEGIKAGQYSLEYIRNAGYTAEADAIEAETQTSEETMGQTLDKAKEAIVVAEIVHAGEKLILPEGVSLPQARDLITRRMEYEEEDVDMSETFDVFPWDGAAALDTVLKRIYGWSPAQSIDMGFFGKIAPKMINVDLDHDKKMAVPWGQFGLPNISGSVSTGVDRKEGRLVFEISASVKRKSEPVVQRLFKELREYIRDGGSIYQGKAIKIRFRDDDGDVLRMPEPKFMRTDDVDQTQLVYSREVHSSIETNLFTPIQRVMDLKANGIPIKRGVLLGGKYGTGKTLAAKVAAKLAVQNGITFIYVSRADELADAIGFAKQYQSPASVVFCEDIDRAMNGDRSVEMDDILNIIDGIDSKNANIMVVLTTNFLNNINAAMLRPGRLDAVIDVKAPDAEAVQRLLRVYGGDAIDMAEDLTEVGEVLDGHIPAVIAEVVKRAKLSQLRLNPPGQPVTNLSSDALLEAATTMSMQLQLLHDADAEKAGPPTLDTALREAVREAVRPVVEETINSELSEVKAYCS